MKTRTIFISLALMLSCVAANAQEKTTSITIGASPYGYAKSVVYVDKDNDFSYFYKPTIGANICIEKQRKGLSSLTEISYYQGKFDKGEIDGQTMSYNMYQTEDFMQMALTQYWGGTLAGKNKRVQLPLYFGIGCGYVQGGPIHNVTGDIATKLRLKFYISNHFGIYAGGTARLGFGSKTDKAVGSEKDKHMVVGNLLCTADAGIIISL